MSNIYVAVGKAFNDSIFYTQTTLVFDAFRQCGAIVCVGDELLGISPNTGDKLVVYGSLESALCGQMKKFSPNDRWLYVVDESNGGNPQPYARAISYMTEVLQTKNIIVTYQNVQHLAVLQSFGCHVVIMPQTVSAIRPLTEKPLDVLVSGQLDAQFFDRTSTKPGFYTERTRIALALKKLLTSQTTLLQYPGMTLSQAWHERVGVGYLETLDMFKLAVVCKGGACDRLVGKYVEMGASHCLPIGDCPTYMPDVMKHAMINTEGMTDVQAVAEISRLLSSPVELRNRSDAYTAEVAKRYITLPNMQRVVREMISL